MNFCISAVTDVGIKKTVNQDCLFVKQYQTAIGNVVFAVLCDGMGGLQRGEEASAAIVEAFQLWAEKQLIQMAKVSIEDCDIRRQWTEIITEQNKKLYDYGEAEGISIGSTVVALLLTEERYYALNIGDSRIYEIGAEVKQITSDHTVIAEEIRRGNMTPQQAETAPMKNVLTRCIGAESTVYPDMFFGSPRKDCVYVLCSDGFRHLISETEMQTLLLLQNEPNTHRMENCARELVERNKRRGETDNISVITIFAT